MMIDEPAPGIACLRRDLDARRLRRERVHDVRSLDFWTSSDFTELIVFPSFSTVVDVPIP
jgi:hypothetical protein